MTTEKRKEERFSAGLSMHRCPRCYLAPTVSFEGENEALRIVLECATHGYMAQGPSLEVAISNWNTYIELTTRKAA